MKYEWTYEDLLKANALLDMVEDFRSASEGLEEEKRIRNKGKR